MFKKLKVNQYKREKKKIIGYILILVFCLAGPSVLYAQQSEKIKELKDKLAISKDNSREKSILYDKLGEQYKFQSSYDSAIYFYQKAAEVDRENNDEVNLAATMNNLANVYIYKSDLTKALEIYLHILKIAEKKEWLDRMGPNYGNIGNIYLYQKQGERAIFYHTKAIAVFEKINDSVALGSGYNLLGTDYLYLNNFDKALEALHRSVKIFELFSTGKVPSKLNELNFYRAKYDALSNLSFALISQKKYQEALVILDKSLEEMPKDISIDTKTATLFTKAEAENGLKEYKKAIISVEQAKSLSQIDTDPLRMMNYYQIISVAYAGLKSYEKAYQNHLLFKEIADTITSKEKVVAINEMETKYETEKKDLQIMQLNNQKKLQGTITWLSIGGAAIALGLFLFALRSRRLQRKLFIQKEELLVKEKEIENKAMEKKMTELEQMALRAQMNPHFIFNSLNSVQHFVLKQDVEGVNKYLGAFAHLIRQTLNNSGKQFVSVDEEIKYLDTYLLLEKMKSDNKFSYTITVCDDIDCSATFIPGMILQPFVENSIKHGIAYKENNDGYIHITLSKNGKLVCMVEDNGIGREKAGEIKRISTNADYESKGMAITLSRVEHINKIYETDIAVTVNDTVDNTGRPLGTTVVLEFPLHME